MPSISPIAERLDALAGWRAELDRRVAELGHWLAQQELLADADAAVLDGLRERLKADKLVLAFVAEFSRGKSELINAIFFADAGRRVLPATPGRTTMCPVELRFDPGVAPRLALLPIETRLRGLSLAELRPRDDHWHLLPLDPRQPQSLVHALAAVTATQRVTQAEAVALGFWSDEQPEDNPPQAADGTVEIPAWRHAVINYPHPLLERGLVVIDTPGLNAVGAEPELTLGLLPTAHAAVFVLAADTGVTRSDLAIWREHLGQASLDRFVVLNKIDALQDPLASAALVQAQIEQQRQVAAQLLDMPPARVFALSARQALAARIDGDAAALQASRLPPLEQALAEQLLPRRQQLLLQAALGTIEQLREATARRLADRRRQQAEQLFELRGLRGKSGAKLRVMVERVDAEVAEFERCTARLAALRAVQAKLLRAVQSRLSSETLRTELGAMQSAVAARPFNLGARAAFDTLLGRLHGAVDAAAAQAEELRQMLQASFNQLNAEFGFAFTLAPVPSMAACQAELSLIEQNYRRYLTLAQAWRMALPGFAEQFRRMLLSKLRMVFENAAGEFELWSKAATSQVEVQLRERRRGFTRRRESLQRVQAAAGELEQRLAEVQAQDEHLAGLQARLAEVAREATAAAQRAAPGLPAQPDPALALHRNAA
ncbi:MAG: dynamin family protein [Burkholderiales bacterium]|nr:dynamin family protein [Burkholderiales bacterium]MDE2566462.1 dynamin family protein [Burkholderiales bacterium]